MHILSSHKDFHTDSICPFYKMEYQMICMALWLPKPTEDVYL